MLASSHDSESDAEAVTISIDDELAALMQQH